MKKVYYETDQVCLWYEESQQLGGGIWLGELESKAYREAFLACTQLIVEKQIKYWLADNLKLKNIRQEDLEWTMQMAPTVMASGLKKMATVVAEDIFNHMSIISLFDRANPILTFQNQYFKNREDAMAWLFAEKEPVTHSSLH